MPSAWPGALDNLTTTHADSDVNAGVHAPLHNLVDDAINKLQATLGINPHGSFATVKARLDAPRLQVLSSRSGNVSVVTGKERFLFPFAVTLVGIQLAIGTAPTGTASTPITGAAVVVDINKNGTTIFTTQANRPIIADSANSGSVATPAVTSMAIGDYLTADIDFIGSTVPGADLSIMLQYKVT